MSYRPKSSVKISHTSDSSFIYLTSNNTYNGDYIETSDGRFFAGKDILNLNVEIIKRKEKEPRVMGPISKKPFYSQKTFGASTTFKTLKVLSPHSYAQLEPIKPIIHNKNLPTEKDYEKKFFYRYFAQRINDRNTYKEISFDSYSKLLNQNPEHDYKLWRANRIKWSLVEGNWPINVEQIKNLRKQGYPRLWTIFPNFSEFAEVTNYEIPDREYPDGEVIPPSLPPAYSTNLTINKKCSNCILFKEGLCSKWNAEVRPNYWCKSWQPKSTPNLFSEIENAPVSYEDWLNSQTTNASNGNSDPGQAPDTSSHGSSGGGGGY